MAQFQEFSVGRLSVSGNRSVDVKPATIISGSQVTRATVLAETEDGINNPGLGSLYLSTDRVYIRTAANAAAADWVKITATAAD